MNDKLYHDDDPAFERFLADCFSPATLRKVPADLELDLRLVLQGLIDEESQRLKLSGWIRLVLAALLATATSVILGLLLWNWPDLVSQADALRSLPMIQPLLEALEHGSNLPRLLPIALLPLALPAFFFWLEREQR